MKRSKTEKLDNTTKKLKRVKEKLENRLQRTEDSLIEVRKIADELSKLQKQK